MFSVLIADADGVYDPTNYNDRLVLGLRGMISEAEIHVRRTRLQHGKLNKARRGELFTCVPTGYVRAGGSIALEPDEQARDAIWSAGRDHRVPRGDGRARAVPGRVLLARPGRAGEQPRPILGVQAVGDRDRRACVVAQAVPPEDRAAGRLRRFRKQHARAGRLWGGLACQPAFASSP